MGTNKKDAKLCQGGSLADEGAILERKAAVGPGSAIGLLGILIGGSWG